MRDKTSWTNYSPGSEPSLFIAGRGFTGHEHLPWFNLINMNGRIYDPLVGQFLSPDNYVQDPTFTQNYNRYTYCLNNPLKYFDPSGYVKLKTWDEFLEVVNNLMENGGRWNSDSGYSEGSQGGGGGYGVPSGSGFQGPGQPYMLGEVTVATKATVKETSNSTIIDSNDDQFLFGRNDNQGQPGGYLTFSDAKAHYQFGGGTPVTVDLNKIDLSYVSLSDFGKDGRALVKLDGKHFSNVNDALVHGTITIQRIGNTNTASIAGQGYGMYNFEMHPWNTAFNIFFRNPATFMGAIVNSLTIIQTPTPIVVPMGGTPYPIYFRGTTTINP
jgi:RHS repeat-associated protein